MPIRGAYLPSGPRGNVRDTTNEIRINQADRRRISRRARARALLFDLDFAVQRLNAELGPAHPQLVSLTGLYHNLLRRWAET